MKMTCVYFILDLPDEDPSMTAAFVKALPILSLAWLVCLQGVKYDKTNTSNSNDYITYNRRILYGLLFAVVGDILLIWQMHSIYFVLGMLSFAGTQISYIIAFGLKPFGLKEFIPSLVGLLGTLGLIVPCLPAGVLTYLVPVYSILIATMMWRSLACFQFNGDIPWRKLFSAIGAILFVVSDCCIAVNKFCFPIPFERMLIMGTYYAAQFSISLSAINSHLHRDIKPEEPPELQVKKGKGRSPSPANTGRSSPRGDREGYRGDEESPRRMQRGSSQREIPTFDPPPPPTGGGGGGGEESMHRQRRRPPPPE